MKPQDKRKLGELEGGGWSVSAASNDEKQLVLRRYLSANESQVWLMDVANGQTRQLLPAPDAKEPATSYHAGRFSPDGRKLWIATDRFGEFTELARLNIASGKLERLSSHIPWDVSALTLTEDGKTVAAQFNVDGRDELRQFDGESGRELPAPKLPPGNVGTTVYDRVRNEIAFTTNGARGPSQIYSLSPEGKVEQWTQAATEGVDTRQFSEQSIVRWKSFDGTSISGLLSQPSATRFPGRRPVIIAIHGGPVGQATVGHALPGSAPGDHRHPRRS
jgi:dipeptidyl aminopeptidase/acylaminoacyl peptidase